MKPYFQALILIAIFLFSATLTNNVFALSASGSGDISFDGKGTIVHMQQPFTIIDVYGTPCTPGQVGLVITRCNAELDTSLLGNGITRAEDIRISQTQSSFRVFFGCDGCTTVGADFFAPVSPGVSRLSDDNAATLQALIDQYGAASIHIRISISQGSVDVFSARRLVQLDIKPGNDDNRLNPKGRGLLPVAILTVPGFNASTVDVDSVEFGISGHEISPTHAALQDVDGDGDVDLLLLFGVPETDVQCGTLFTYLRGETSDGTPFAGTDSINTVGCK